METRRPVSARDRLAKAARRHQARAAGRDPLRLIIAGFVLGLLVAAGLSYFHLGSAARGVVLAASLLAALAGGIWLLVVAFRASLGQGLLCLIPLYGIYFAIRYWPARRPMAAHLIGLAGLVGWLLLGN
jgi:hypothetical protein